MTTTLLMTTNLLAMSVILCLAMNVAVIVLSKGSGRGLAACMAAIFGIVVLCGTPVQAADFGVPKPVKTTRPATMGVSDVKTQIKTIYRAYRAIEVRYVQEVRHESPSSNFISKMRYTYAYKGEKRLKGEKQLNGQPEQEGASYTFAFNGNFQQQYRDEPSQLTIYKHKESITDIDAYINVLGIPMQNTERP